MATFEKKGSLVNEASNTIKETRIITAEGYRRAHGRGIKQGIKTTSKATANRPAGSRSKKQ